jgi:threonine/homoserine/homoserine lactone efflux protein
MLAQAIGDLLPVAAGVALSPVPIIAVILMLGTSRGRTNGPAFALGWVVALAIVSAVVLVVVGDDASDPDSATSTGIGWGKVALGVLFLVLAARRWRTRPREGEEPKVPRWMAAVDTFTPVRSFAVGAALAGVNPKNLALTLAAAASIAQAGLSGGGEATATVVFVVLGSLTVAGPVVVAMAAADRAAGPLASVKRFMSEHDAVIMMVVLLVLGAKLLGDGFGLTAG